MSAVFFSGFLLLFSCNNNQGSGTENISELQTFYNPSGLEWKKTEKGNEEERSTEGDSGEIDIKEFAGPKFVPSPSCIAVAATGEVFVGVDRIGSLGKDPGKGSIIKLIDSNNDGHVDEHIEFAKVDNPRGIISLGDKLFVLHTTFSKET